MLFFCRAIGLFGGVRALRVAQGVYPELEAAVLPSESTSTSFHTTLDAAWGAYRALFLGNILSFVMAFFSGDEECVVCNIAQVDLLLALLLTCLPWIVFAR